MSNVTRAPTAAKPARNSTARRAPVCKLAPRKRRNRESLWLMSMGPILQRMLRSLLAVARRAGKSG